MDIAEELPTVISFCSGYGGIERGLDLAGVKHRVLAYVEIEAFAIANLVAKMESGQLVPAPIFTDLKTFPAHLFRDCVDIITGGYPCQPFSAAGKRLGTEDPRHLWPYILDHINAIRPVRCFFENVEGHISLGLREVIDDLEGAGYDATWGIFSASEVGAPHQRKRVYIVADTGVPNGHDAEANSQRPNSNSVRSYREAKYEHRRVKGGTELCNEQVSQLGQVCCDVADTDNAGQQPSGGAIPEPEVRDNTRRGGEELADTDSTSWQGRGIPSGVHKEYSIAYGSGNEVRAETSQQWLPEPRVGRVVDGCADRVDRVRLLGNGVVPQTAAKAWTTLTSRGKK